MSGLLQFFYIYKVSIHFYKANYKSMKNAIERNNKIEASKLIS